MDGEGGVPGILGLVTGPSLENIPQSFPLCRCMVFSGLYQEIYLLFFIQAVDRQGLHHYVQIAGQPPGGGAVAAEGKHRHRFPLLSTPTHMKE